MYDVHCNIEYSMAANVWQVVHVLTYIFVSFLSELFCIALFKCVNV